MAGLEGKILGDCKIIKRLGEGGMGQVYLAEQLSIGRQVAVKVLRPSRPASGDDGPAPLADAPDRFKLEARAVAALEHPYILPVHDFGLSQDGLMYLVMPLMPDGSLLDAIRAGSPRRRYYLPMDPAEAAPLIFQAASALQYAHDHNVIHRDVKPENFLVRPQRDGSIQLLLADFGLAKVYNPSSGSATLAVGTADYVAPEQIEGHPLPASDQYALAVMTYELLVGRLPFIGGVGEVALKHLRTLPPPPRSINPKLPVAIEEVILRAMSKKAADRWPSVLEYARAYNVAVKELDQGRQKSATMGNEEETIPSMRGPQLSNEETRITPPPRPPHQSHPPQPPVQGHPNPQQGQPPPQRGPKNVAPPAPAAVFDAPTMVAPQPQMARPYAPPAATPAPASGSAAPRPGEHHHHAPHAVSHPVRSGQPPSPAPPAPKEGNGLNKLLLALLGLAALLIVVTVVVIALAYLRDRGTKPLNPGNPPLRHLTPTPTETFNPMPTSQSVVWGNVEWHI
jgi:serine/threonine protein kinase